MLASFFPLKEKFFQPEKLSVISFNMETGVSFVLHKMHKTSFFSPGGGGEGWSLIRVDFGVVSGQVKGRREHFVHLHISYCGRRLIVLDYARPLLFILLS